METLTADEKAERSQYANNIINTMVAQLGGYNKLKVMINFKVNSFTYDKGNVTAHCVHMTRGAKRNYVNITYNRATDLYDLKFMKIIGMKEPKDILELKDIGCEQLKDIYERETGLRLSL